MELAVNRAVIDVRFRVIFSERQFDLVRQEPQISFIDKILKSFDLNLNNITLDNTALANNYIHFSKFYDQTWVDVAIGLEEFEYVIRYAKSDEQIFHLYNKLTKLIEQYPISFQRITIQQHLSSEGDVISFLRSLNPNLPSSFKDIIRSTGAHYFLKIPDHELTIYIMIVESLFTPGGLYLTIENEFSPNKYDFVKSYEIIKEYYDFILKALNLSIKEA